MEKTGIVVGIEKDCVLVDVIRPTECGGKCGHCTDACKEKTMVVKVNNHLQAAIGDNVVLTTTPKKFVKATFLMYTLPLIAFVIGVFTGDALADCVSINPEILSVLIGFGLMTITYLIIAYLTNNYQKNQTLLTIKKIIRRENVITQ